MEEMLSCDVCGCVERRKDFRSEPYFITFNDTENGKDKRVARLCIACAARGLLHAARQSLPDTPIIAENPIPSEVQS